MALQMKTSTRYGLDVNNAYIRINSLYGSKDLIAIGLNYYVSRVSFESNAYPIKEEGYEFVPNVDGGSDNFIKQGYEYLKTLPEFSQASDVIE
jgi:hypothetical protein